MGDSELIAHALALVVQVPWNGDDGDLAFLEVRRCRRGLGARGVNLVKAKPARRDLVLEVLKLRQRRRLAQLRLNLAPSARPLWYYCIMTHAARTRTPMLSPKLRGITDLGIPAGLLDHRVSAFFGRAHAHDTGTDAGAVRA